MLLDENNPSIGQTECLKKTDSHYYISVYISNCAQTKMFIGHTKMLTLISSVFCF